MKLRYISQDTDRHGNHRTYVRKPGCKKVRIEAEIGSEAFFIEYAAALKACPLAESDVPSVGTLLPGSLHWLVSRYMSECGEYRRFDLTTRKQTKSRLERLCQSKDEKGRTRGSKPYKGLEPHHLVIIRDEWDATPTVANALMADLRGVWEWAKSIKIATSNPANDVQPLAYVSDGYHTWTVEEIRQYEAKWPIGTMQRKAFDALLYTGVRRSDLVKLPEPSSPDDLIRWTETKGRKKRIKHRVLPIIAPLWKSIEACPSKQLVMIVTSFGRPFTPAGFSNWFKEACIAASLPHCSAHGLRKGGAVIAVERGATAKQLQAIYGWEKLATAEVYVTKADQIKLASAALHLLMPEETENEAVPLKEGGAK